MLGMTDVLTIGYTLNPTLPRRNFSGGGLVTSLSGWQRLRYRQRYGAQCRFLLLAQW